MLFLISREGLDVLYGLIPLNTLRKSYSDLMTVSSYHFQITATRLAS